MVGTIIWRYGSDELKRDVLSKIVSGESICSLGYSEPGCGSDVFAAATRATRDGAGWRIDGQKMFTSGANLADYVLMLTRTDPDVPKHKGLTMFIVPLKAPGVEVKPVYTFQDERTNITYYDGVKIPDSYRLGDVNGGVKVMSAGLELEHGGGFSKSLGEDGASRRRIVPGNRLSRPAADRGPRRAGAARAGETRICCCPKCLPGARFGPAPRRSPTRVSVRWPSSFRRRSS